MAFAEGRLWIMAANSLLFSSLLCFAAEQPAGKPPAAEAASAKQQLIATLIDRLGSLDQTTRAQAATELVDLGMDAYDAVDAARASWDLDLARHAARCMADINRTVAESVAIKIEPFVCKLGSDSYMEREQAAKALIDLGIPATYGLKTAQLSKDLEIVNRAKFCLRIIEYHEFVRLIQLMDDPDPEVQLRAISLRNYGDAADRIVPLLIKRMALAKECPKQRKVRELAIGILRSYGKRAKDAIPALIVVLQLETDTEKAQTDAIELLGTIGSDAKESIPILLQYPKRRRRTPLLEFLLKETYLRIECDR